jgi:hypothetical protein
MLRVVAAALSVAMIVVAAPASAQTAGAADQPAQNSGAAAQPATEAAGGPAESTGAAAQEADVALLTGEEIDALTARVALYPDPLLELTLQGATFPIQAVQAARFLEKHAKDPSLKPDAEWDESILGLLNYPVVLEAMNSDLDWTEALGNAVLTQLGDVQDSIQQFRSQLYAGGVLKSDDKQRVIVSNDVIAILPADAEIIYVPQYDAAAAEQPEETASAEAETPAEEALAPAAGTEATEVAPAAEVAAAPEYQTAAAPVAAAPVYSTAPVVYSQPYPSFWSSAAPFLGGAAIGGLIGYALADDDDDDCCDFDDDDWDGGGNNWSKDINIEDSNIVINRDDDILDNRGEPRRRDPQAELRKRQTRGQTAAVNQRDVRPKGTAPAREARAARPQQQQSAVKKPAGQQKAAKKAVGQRPGDAQAKRADSGALSGAKNVSGKQAKAESRRGSQSRAVAQNKGPTKQQVQAPRKQQGGAAFSKPKNNKQVVRQSNRGKSSAGGKRRRG